MTASWFVYFLPYAALARAFDQTANAYDALIIATSAGASIWVSLVLVISRRLEVRREVGMLHYARPLASALAPPNPELRRLLERARIELMCSAIPIGWLIRAAELQPLRAYFQCMARRRHDTLC
jgi:hypothetical protein